MIRVVLDSTVLVSAVVSPTGPNGEVFNLITAGKIRPCLTLQLMAEYHRVFQYERLHGRRRIARVRNLLEAV